MAGRRVAPADPARQGRPGGCLPGRGESASCSRVHASGFDWPVAMVGLGRPGMSVGPGARFGGVCNNGASARTVTRSGAAEAVATTSPGATGRGWPRSGGG
ncbi:hypothetical protein ROJ8625_00608 [Roseivivax jejudonensis]|uniref:Uncharacterized protein n=1 Tax=Roseivivax jejudonensis TaxID=1529041 RepID=A0A1X6YDJ8_9RHOB|nr:hypothetical protein ROJ8625_00608 [Roseivivax jejudonensis]